MARPGGGRARVGGLSAFRATLLAQRAAAWAVWATEGMRAEHDETDRQIRAGEAVTLPADRAFSVLDAMGDSRASLLAWGGDGYGRDWTLSTADELSPET